MQRLTRRGPQPEDVRAVRIQANLLTLGRELRDNGVNLGSGQILSLVDATSYIDCGRRDDFYHAARATLVTSPEHIPVFDATFARFWRRLTNPIPPVETPIDHEGAPDAAPPSSSSNSDEQADKKKSNAGKEGAQRDRAILAVEDSDKEDSDGGDELESPPEDVLVFSAREVLRKKDFAQFSPDEIAEARRIIEGMTWRLGTRKTRRREKSVFGEFIDYRRTLRNSLKHGGVPIDLKRRRRKERMRPLVLICDISGSMDRYSRLLLQFVHAMEHGLDTVEVFVFGTRLTRITRELRKRNVDDAIEQVVKSVDDWSGGTRIGESIKEFNYKWSRRVLRSGATVVMISDGWDRGDPKLLGSEMSRLQRSCRRLIWLNPLLGAPGYQPLTQGIRAALPYVDAFLPVHNLKSLEILADILGDMDDSAPVRAHRSIIGGASNPIVARPMTNDRGELVVNVGPMVRGSSGAAARRTRRAGHERLSP